MRTTHLSVLEKLTLADECRRAIGELLDQLKQRTLTERPTVCLECLNRALVAGLIPNLAIYNALTADANNADRDLLAVIGGQIADARAFVGQEKAADGLASMPTSGRPS
jgi:hypothetical protein